MAQKFSRRGFLALAGAVTVEIHKPLGLAAAEFLFAPAEGKNGASAKADALSATLQWSDPEKSSTFEKVRVRISQHSDLSSPIADVSLPAGAATYRLGVAPSKKYYWSVVPVDKGKVKARAAKGSFTTPEPARDPHDEDDNVRYAGVRPGAHWVEEKEVAAASPPEPISPWFYRKQYDGVKPPMFDQAKEDFPVPVLDEPELIDVYWYCWRTLMKVWLFGPDEPNHQAVANMIGSPTWAGWGSTMVWDTAFIYQFARYGHRAYPFITAYDNVYARQHENGFICRESDRNNRETYSNFPLNPPLLAWSEWQYYQLSGDEERLAQVLAPIVKHYEWWLRFQRRSNGLYWTSGVNEADDSPRNHLMYYAASASSYQALNAMILIRIARVLGRPDLEEYFQEQHTALGKMVNEHFWDEKHHIYNDLTKDGKFITELQPGVLCKHAHMFWPMLAEIAPPDRVDGLVRELLNPNTFFLPSGVPSLSADSKGFNKETGHYWKGSVWPPVQCLVQDGLRACGKRDLAQKFARKYLDAMVKAYQRDHTIKEYLSPYEARGQGDKEFVGWGGIGPVQDLIEYVLGFEVSAPAQKITWHIDRVDRHGIQNLYLGKTKVDLICEKRPNATSPCNISVTSAARVTLDVYKDGKKTTKQVGPGVDRFVIA